MNDSARHALDRIEAAMDRSGRKRRHGLSTSPIVLALGLVLAYQLLVRLIPSLLAQILPGGFEQGAMLSGPSRLVWRMAWFCHLRFQVVVIGVVAVMVVAVFSGRHPATRPIVWVLAVASIVLDGAILVIALKAGMDGVGVGQVFG